MSKPGFKVLDSAGRAVDLQDTLDAGEKKGHPFRGNQHTSTGGGERDPSELKGEKRAKIANLFSELQNVVSTMNSLPSSMASSKPEYESEIRKIKSELRGLGEKTDLKGNLL